MPRAPRIQFEDAVYHVLARGNRREPIVLDDEDRSTFVETLGEACAHYDVDEEELRRTKRGDLAKP